HRHRRFGRDRGDRQLVCHLRENLDSRIDDALTRCGCLFRPQRVVVRTGRRFHKMERITNIRSMSTTSRPSDSYARAVPMRVDLFTIVVDDYDEAIQFFVDALGFDLVEDSPARTNDGRVKRWVVVRPAGAEA